MKDTSVNENFRYKTNNYSLHYIVRQIESGRMEVNPQFKDLKHSSNRDKSLFIESLILGIPTQPIWCEESSSGDYIVIEGSERLITLVDFFRGAFALRNVKIRKEYTGCYFNDLPYYERLSLEDRYLFTFIVINYDTVSPLKYEFFRRLLNDTGNTNYQFARNFAWRNSFSFLQEIREDCKDLVIFVPRDSRWRLQPLTTQFSSKIDEVYLNLLMILTILGGANVSEDAYLDSNFSSDDLLDWTMKYFDEYIDRKFESRHKIFVALSQVAEHLNGPPRILLSNTVRTDYVEGDDLALPEFYLFFIRASANKLEKKVNWRSANARRFIRSTSARNLISYIFEARND